MNRKFIFNLNKYINSNDFLLNAYKLKPEFRIKFVGLIIEYLILHKDFWRIDNYINYLLKQQKNNLLVGNYWELEGKREYLINSVSDKLLTKNKNKISRYINKTFYKEGFFYHSFNGGLLNLMKRNGLNSEKKSKILINIKNIENIFINSTYYNILGLINSYENNRIFLSANFQSLYKYTLSSPEWFDQFTCRSLNHLLSPSVNENAFYERDYKKAKSNIIDLIDNINSEKIVILNKLWKRKIKRKGFNLDKLLNYCLNEFSKNYKNSKKHLGFIFEEIIKSKNSSFINIDNRKYNNKERLFIYMDTYDNFCRELNNQEISNKISEDNKIKIINKFNNLWKIFGQKKYKSFLINRSIIKKDKKVSYNKLFLENQWDITYNKHIKYNELFLINLPNLNLEK